MVFYTCPKCNKIFTKKSHFLNHVELKKKPCVITNDNFILKNTQKSSKNLKKSSLILEDKKGYNCNFCNYSSLRIDNFKRHLTTCKVRKEETQEKEAIYQELIRRMELLENQNNKLFMKNKELNNEISLLKSNTNTNTNTKKNIQNNKNIKNLNNGIINNTIIIQHGKEDLNKIDDKVFLDAFLKSTGAKIPEKIIEGIHFNKKFPEYKNIYISDINREKVMIHNGKNWILTPGDNLTSNLLDKSICFSENKYECITTKDIFNERNKKKIINGLKIMELMKEFDSVEQDEIGTPITKDDKDRRNYLRNKAEEYIKLLLYNNRNEILNEDILVDKNKK